MRIEKPVSGEPTFKRMPPLIPVDAKKGDDDGINNNIVRGGVFYWNSGLPIRLARDLVKEAQDVN